MLADGGRLAAVEAQVLLLSTQRAPMVPGCLGGEQGSQNHSHGLFGHLFCIVCFLSATPQKLQRDWKVLVISDTEA